MCIFDAGAPEKTEIRRDIEIPQTMEGDKTMPHDVLLIYKDVAAIFTVPCD